MSQPVFTFDDALRGIRKRKIRVLMILVLVPTAVMIATLLSPKEYKSTAKLFVRLGRENSSMDATATLGQTPVVATPLSREAEIKSISELILNRDLFADVVDEIGAETILKKKKPNEDETSDASDSPGVVDRIMGWLAQAGVVNDLPLRERAIIKIQKNLSVEPVEQSNVVLIAYESHDPKLSQQVVESVTQKYLVRHGEIHRTEGTYSFLSEQTSLLKKELEGNEKLFEELKQESGVVDIDAQRQVLVNRLAKITDAKLEVDAQYQSMQEEVSRLQKLRDESPKSIVLEETVGVGNDGVDGMRQELYRLELQKEDLLSKFDETNVRVKAIMRQIANAEAILKKAEQARKESKSGPNEVYQKLEIELSTRIPQLHALSKKSAAYEAQIADLVEGQKKFADLETNFRRLNRQISIDDASYRKYVNNLEEAKIDSLLKSKNLSNISIAQPASLELKPSKPNKLLNLILGVFLGGLIGFGWAIYREFKTVMSNTNNDLAREVELPVVGSLGQIPSSLGVEAIGRVTADQDEELVAANE